MISFFYKRGGSSMIRGKQMVDALRARSNPRSNYDGDTCIYVKMQPPAEYPDKSWLDIVDGIERMKWLERHPDIGVIASSCNGYKYLHGKLENNIVCIPQHHCNYDREVCDDRPPETIGVVGGNGAIMNPELKEKLDILHISSYKCREDVVAAYKRIDIQIVWRVTDNPLKNPLKIINAASFGIPTIAYPSPAYDEVEDYYYPANTIQDVLDWIRALKCRGWDKQVLIDMAEEYHIEHIAKRYMECL